MPKVKYLEHEYDIADGTNSDDVKDALSSLFPEILGAEAQTDKEGNISFRIRGGVKGE